MSSPFPVNPPTPVIVEFKDGNIGVNPHRAHINRLNQKVVFTFTPSISDFAPNPITFPTPPPPGFAPWPATGTITPGPGPNQLTADANAPVPPRGQIVSYKYDVHAADGTTLDPDIQNDPFPPGAEGEDEEGGPGGRPPIPGGHQHKS